MNTVNENYPGTERKTAKLVGLAFLFSNLTFILGTVVMVESWWNQSWALPTTSVR